MCVAQKTQTGRIHRQVLVRVSTGQPPRHAPLPRPPPGVQVRGRVGSDFICSHADAHLGHAGASGPREALLDEAAHQPLWSLLVLSQHLVGAADLVPLQAVEEGDTHHGRCREQRSRQPKALDFYLRSLRGDEVSPAVPSGEGATAVNNRHVDRWRAQRSKGPSSLPPCPALPSPHSPCL